MHITDAQQVIDALHGVPNVTVDVAPMVDAAAASLAEGARALTPWGLADRWPEIESPANAPILGNLKARSRAVVLRGVANQYEGLVLGVPRTILEKAPSADLWTGHTDEAELGVSYEEMDLVIAVGQRFDDAAGPAAYRDLPGLTGLPETVVHRVLDRIACTRFKRAAKPTFGGVFGVEG
jgi:NH3-dependent NAD+ synthetase